MKRPVSYPRRFLKGRVRMYNDCKSVGIALYSRSEDDTSPGEDGERYHNTLILSAFGYALWIKVPELVKPHTYEQVYSLDPARTWTAIERRVFGIDLYDDTLVVRYGLNDTNVTEPKRWSMCLPWKDYEFIRHSVYNLDHSWLADVPKDWSERHACMAQVPKATITFIDYDGAEEQAHYHIAEREWHVGAGRWRWLRHFFAPIIRRDLEVEYPRGVGRGKESWKGGILGESIVMLPNETPESAFARLRTKSNR